MSHTRYLITGGAGFIGSYLARRLLEHGDDVTIVDNLLTGSNLNVPDEAECIELDIGTPDAFRRLPKHPVDAVLNLAAQSSGEISFERPEYDLTTNVVGTFNMLQSCKFTGTERFVFASSMSVYGAADETPVSEDRHQQPQSFYGASKLAGESYVNLFGRLGLQTTMLRLFNLYGPGQNLENLRQGMVSIYLYFVLNEEPVLVKGSGERFRDHVYVDDVVDAWLSVLHDPISFGRTYNVGSGTKTRVHQSVAGLVRAFGKDPETYPVQYAGDTPGDQFGIRANVDRIRQEIGWYARVGLEVGLSAMAEWAQGERRSS